MVLKFIFVCVFGIFATADSHIIIYEGEAEPESKDIFKIPLNFKTQMKDVKKQLSDMKSQMGSFEERFDRLEQSKATETTAIISLESTTKATTPITEATQAPLIMQCPDGWLMSEESCYFFDSKEVYFPAAEKICKEQQAHLVHLETETENALIKSFLKNESNGARVLHWIGMTDSETEGVWKFTGTNITIPFTDWLSGEPQNHSSQPSGQDCAAFVSKDSYYWADINCINRAARAVCEKKPVAVSLD